MSLCRQKKIRETTQILGVCAILFATTASGISIIDLQPSRSDTILDLKSQNNEGAAFVRLVNLNPNINSWFVLSITWAAQNRTQRFHIENPASHLRLVFLDRGFKAGLRIVDGPKEYRCPLWENAALSELVSAEASRKTYAPICEGRLFVRNETEGKESTQEWVADFLRGHVWAGEQITSLVKTYLYADKFLLTADPNQKIEDFESDDPNLIKPKTVKLSKAPLAAKVAGDISGKTMDAKEMGLSVEGANIHEMSPGQWYESDKQKGVFVSAIQANYIDPKIFETFPKRVQKLDAVESAALVYVVAFDLDRFNLDFKLGTRHPSPEWSERTPEKVRQGNSAGPDGIKDYLPLRMTGKINSIDAQNVIATFTGGFKRDHGAFKWGKLAENNFGSHYGFVENGVIMSKLQPELATLIVYKNGKVELKTWDDEDRVKSMPKVKHARQNGVPLIEWDEKLKVGVPGEFVGNWTLGNWSGSLDSKQRALRAGMCVQENNGQRYLLYGYFSSVTPNAMARVFQAYQCSYAMHLDMNALEHTYLAVYEHNEQGYKIQHLIEGMSVLDMESKGQVVPRFVGTADNRDFFYLTRRQ